MWQLTPYTPRGEYKRSQPGTPCIAPDQDNAQADNPRLYAVSTSRVSLQAYGVGPASSGPLSRQTVSLFFMWKPCDAVDSVPAATTGEVVMCGYLSY